MTDDTVDLPAPQALAASLLHLMTRYAEAPCPRLATLIARELRFLEQAGDATPVLLHSTAKRLFGRWVALQHCAATPTSIH